MSNNTKELQHFLLTRFNLVLWNKDKEGNKVRTTEWLEHRFTLFEHYCLPSIKNQTCHDFEWIVLFDSKTPDNYRVRIEEYKNECPQFIPIFVEPEKSRYFALIFRSVMVRRLNAKRVVSTYLDNDDALSTSFVEDLQLRTLNLRDGTFIRYSDGYQFYADCRYLVQIHYPKNHFVSVVEKGDATVIKGIFGYGGHLYLDKITGMTIENVGNVPMWCEVIHDKNMINDANFLFGSRMIKDEKRLIHEFAINESVTYKTTYYVLKFLPRYFKSLLRRVRIVLYGWG